MAQHHPSIPESNRYPQPSVPFAKAQDASEELGAPSQGVPESHPLHLDAEIPGGREATHRRVLTRSKLPVDVGEYTYVGGEDHYRGETFSAEGQRGNAAARASDLRDSVAAQKQADSRSRGPGSKLNATGAFAGAAGVGLLLLSQPYLAVPALVVAGSAFYLGRRARREA